MDGVAVTVKQPNQQQAAETPVVKTAAETNVQAAQPVAKKQRLQMNKNLKRVLILLVVLGIAAAFVFMYMRLNQAKSEVSRLSNPQEAAREEANRIRNEVGQFYAVPDEDPTVATVTDASKLKEQAFFSKAENGDRVLIFAQARRAVLYRPSTKKIIEVAPINIGNNSQQAAGSDQQASQDQQ